MKLAVCLSGQPRYLNGPQMSSLQDLLKGDVYCFFWGPPIDVSMLNPKRVQFQEQEVFSDEGAAQRCASMYSAMQRSYALVPEPYEYDFIIRLRTDIWIDSMPTFKDLDRSRIHFPAITSRHGTPNILNHCFVCPPVFADTLFSIAKYHEQMPCDASQYDEKLMYEYLEHTNLLKHVQQHSSFRLTRIYRGGGTFHIDSVSLRTAVAAVTLAVLLFLLLLNSILLATLTYNATTSHALLR